MSNKRIREKKAIKQALASPFILLPDIHGPEPRIVGKIRRAVEKQVLKGGRKIEWVGDILEGSKI